MERRKLGGMNKEYRLGGCLEGEEEEGGEEGEREDTRSHAKKTNKPEAKDRGASTKINTIAC
jgi:hypothetical protein